MLVDLSLLLSSRHSGRQFKQNSNMVRLLVFDSFVFISALIFFGYLLGLHKFLSKNGNNGCEMTYMYEYPQFVVSKYHLLSNVSAYLLGYIPVIFIETRPSLPHTNHTLNILIFNVLGTCQSSIIS